MSEIDTRIMNQLHRNAIVWFEVTNREGLHKELWREIQRKHWVIYLLCRGHCAKSTRGVLRLFRAGETRGPSHNVTNILEQNFALSSQRLCDHREGETTL